MNNDQLIAHLNKNKGYAEGLNLFEPISFYVVNLDPTLDTLIFSNCTIFDFHLIAENDRIGEDRPKLTIEFRSCTVTTLSIECSIKKLVITSNEEFRNPKPSVVQTLNFYECACHELRTYESTIELIHTEIPRMNLMYFRESTIGRLDHSWSAKPMIIAVRKSTIRSLEVANASKEIAFNFFESVISKLQIIDCLVSFVRIRDNTQSNSVFISGRNVETLSIEKYTNAANDRIILKDIKVKNLFLTSYSGLGSFEISNAVIPKINILESSLAKGQFNSVDLSDSTLISFKRSNIANMLMLNVNWPNTYKVTEEEIVDKATLQKAWETKESYRQIKSIYLRQNNFIEASEFRHHELRTFHRILNFKRRWPKIFNRLGDSLILWTSWKASDYGKSISRPLLGMLVFHSLFFIAMILTNKEFPVQFVHWIDHNNDALCEGWRLFWWTINPAHSFSIGTIAIFGLVDTLMRVSSGYFIYYFLKASRKFHTT